MGRKNRWLCLFVIIGTVNNLMNAQQIAFPFPSHIRYSSDVFKPEGFTQEQLDDSTKAFYDIWKAVHIKNDCPDNNQYYVLNDENRSDGRNHGNICVSEGQGYGMLITVIMAGYDMQAQTVFNGLYHFYKGHPSSVNKYLMSWNILTGCKTKTSKDDNYSATDGDLDIALALLMADKQWGSNGDINYKAEALYIVHAIMKHEINKQTYTILLSDALQTDDPQYFDTRTSDFMPAHFREFYKASNDSNWVKVIDKEYKIFKAMQEKHSPTSGLIPDFIQYKGNKYIPAIPKYLESEYDGHYYYNACRVPMRLSIDYFLSGDLRAKEILEKMNHWVKKKTFQKPERLFSGFMLTGANIKDNDYSTPAFIGPFVVSAMIGNENKEWLNNLYPYFLKLDHNEFRYYNNTLKMLCLLMISGNFWTPSSNYN